MGPRTLGQSVVFKVDRLVLSRLFALPCCLLIALLTLLPLAPAQAVGLPGLLGSASKPQPQAEVPLGQSLDEVIKTLENDQQRTQLLSDLKKLRADHAKGPAGRRTRRARADRQHAVRP